MNEFGYTCHVHINVAMRARCVSYHSKPGGKWYFWATSLISLCIDLCSALCSRRCAYSSSSVTAAVGSMHMKPCASSGFALELFWEPLFFRNVAPQAHCIVALPCFAPQLRHVLHFRSVFFCFVKTAASRVPCLALTALCSAMSVACRSCRASSNWQRLAAILH
jgi:hypothetical protein